MGRKIEKWLMPAAALLLCLVLLSSHMVGGIYAKYSTTVSGSDSAHVAKFQVEIQGSGTVSLVAGETYGVYQFDVVNHSEVAVHYTVILRNVPDHLGVRTNDTLIQWPEGGVITFNGADLAPGATGEFELEIVSKDIENDQNLTFKVNVNAEQID